MNKKAIFPLIVLGLALAIAFILIFGLLYMQQLNASGSPVPFNHVLVINIILIITLLVLLILIRNVYLLFKQEKRLEIQDFYIEHLKELVGLIRTQRHDFVNHLQVVYALLKTGKTEKALCYIEDLSHDVQITGQMLQINIPELSALLLAKMESAVTKNVSFKIILDSNLEGLQIKPLELITIVGNLLDNAFDAVQTLPRGNRNVVFKVFETPKCFIFQTINHGYISKELREKIFQMGYSTKDGQDRGIGLSSVKSVVEKNKGKIIVNSSKTLRTKFTVILPKPLIEESMSK